MKPKKNIHKLVSCVFFSCDFDQNGFKDFSWSESAPLAFNFLPA